MVTAGMWRLNVRGGAGRSMLRLHYWLGVAMLSAAPILAFFHPGQLPYLLLPATILVADIWSFRRENREAEDFERRFGKRPRWSPFRARWYGTGWEAPEGCYRTPEMDEWLATLRKRRLQQHWRVIWFVCFGLALLALGVIVAKRL